MLGFQKTSAGVDQVQNASLLDGREAVTQVDLALGWIEGIMKSTSASLRAASDARPAAGQSRHAARRIDAAIPACADRAASRKDCSLLVGLKAFRRTGGIPARCRRRRCAVAAMVVLLAET